MAHSARATSRERDDEIKFSSFGDRVGSGIALTRKRWTGGEASYRRARGMGARVCVGPLHLKRLQLVTDPNYFKRSLKPRTMFYSPIGDGVVQADGVEWHRGNADLSPRVHITHERVVERGDGGAGGRRVYEHTWSGEFFGGGRDDEPTIGTLLLGFQRAAMAAAMAATMTAVIERRTRTKFGLKRRRQRRCSGSRSMRAYPTAR